MTRFDLAELAELRSGVAFPLVLQGRTSGDYLFAKVGDISRCARSGLAVLESAEHYVDALDLTTLKAQPLPPGSILFAKIGEAIRANHRVLAGVECLVDNNVMAVVVDESRCNHKYMYHFLRTVDFYSLADRTTVPSLRKSRLGSLRVPLPPLSEQARIADILDRAEALLTKRRAALERLDELGQAMFLEMFGDPVTNPKGWEKPELASVATIGTGTTPPRANPAFFSGDVPWVKSTEVAGAEITVTGERISEDAVVHCRCRVHPAGSVIIALYGQGRTRGRVGILGVPAATNQACGVVQPRGKLLSAFLFAQLSGLYEQLRALGRGGNQENLNLGLLGKFQVLVPPLPLQQSFADRIAVLERLKAHHRASLAEKEALFASLQHRAFRGEL